MGKKMTLRYKQGDRNRYLSHLKSRLIFVVKNDKDKS